MESREKTVEKRTQQDYTMAFKLGVLSRVEKGEFTYKQAQKHYGIQGRSTVLVWLRKYGNLDWSNPPFIPCYNPKKHPPKRLKDKRKN